MSIDFYFDFLSPYSYLARHRLAELVLKHGKKIQFHAINLAEAKIAIGNVGPSNRDLKVKLDHLKVDLQRWADRYGIPLVFPSNYNSHGLNAGLHFPGCIGHEAEYVRIAFEETWGKGHAPDAQETIAQVCNRMDMNFDDFCSYIQSEDAAKCYSQATQEAIDRKIFGVPSMVMHDQMWWGNDRLIFIEEILQKETVK